MRPDIIPETVALILSLTKFLDRDGIRFEGSVNTYAVVGKFAEAFCEWADDHIDFADLPECWPHFVEGVYDAVQHIDGQAKEVLPRADSKDFAAIAAYMELPLLDKPKTRDPDNLAGYRAAFICIKEMVARQQKKRPGKKGPRINPRSRDYRAGEFMGLVMANSFGAFGEFPKSNKEPILAALDRAESAT